MTGLDPRLTAARPDMAAAHLRGRVEAPRYVEATMQEVIAGVAPMRAAPSHDAPLLTEALYGERVAVYEIDDEGWAWGQLATDGYVGFLPAAALLAPGPAPTHRVTALRTLMFPGPSIKLPPIAALPMGARVAVIREQDGFAITASGGYLPPQHLAPVDAVAPDFVGEAERLIGAPYLWGGKSSLGIDCSGLVQVALDAAGIAAPRDSDMQQDALGRPVELERFRAKWNPVRVKKTRQNNKLEPGSDSIRTGNAPAELRRGDLLFWKGHVAIARDGETLLHANAFHMAVAAEPAAEAIARIAAAGSAVTVVRRLDGATTGRGVLRV